MKKQIKLQLTNGYYLHFDQLSRILQYSLEQSSRKRIPRLEFLETLGMTERQFENLTSISVGLGLTKRSTFLLTPLGKAIAQRDIYFDRVDTLWMLHYVISSESRWIVWNRIINNVIPENDIITTEVALPYYSDLSSAFSERTITKKMPKEILSVLNAYGEQDFSKLHILRQDGSGKYLKDNPEKMHPLPFLYCLLHFRDGHYPNATGLLKEDILHSDDSPGRVLLLPEYITAELLMRLHDMRLIGIETFGDLDQIRFRENINKAWVLNEIYGIEQ